MKNSGTVCDWSSPMKPNLTSRRVHVPWERWNETMWKNCPEGSHQESDLSEEFKSSQILGPTESLVILLCHLDEIVSFYFLKPTWWAEVRRWWCAPGRRTREPGKSSRSQCSRARCTVQRSWKRRRWGQRRPSNTWRLGGTPGTTCHCKIMVKAEWYCNDILKSTWLRAALSLT